MDIRLLESSTFFLRTIDLAPTHVPERPGLYKRISHDKLGLAEGIARQDEDCELLRERDAAGDPLRVGTTRTTRPPTASARYAWPTARSRSG